jgi:hypothetical protein
MHTTRSSIALPVAANTARRYDEAMTYLANGWVELTYRKVGGEVVTRLATRNPTLIDTFGDRWSLEAVRKSDDPWGDNIVYWDHAKGGIRSCRADEVVGMAIPGDCPEVNH